MLSPFHEKYLLTEIHPEIDPWDLFLIVWGLKAKLIHMSSISNLTSGLLSGRLSLSQQPPCSTIRQPALNRFSWFSCVSEIHRGVSAPPGWNVQVMGVSHLDERTTSALSLCLEGRCYVFSKLKIYSHSVLSAHGEHFLPRRYV